MIAILANGPPPSRPAALEAFRAAATLVCCDGALEIARALGREPDFAVGDGDSAGPAADAMGGRFVKIAEQDTNDLAKAFRFALERFPGADRIAILGASGLREDHTLANIALLFDFAAAARGAAVEMITDYGTFHAFSGGRTFESEEDDEVSVFAAGPDAHVSSAGLRWPLDGVRFSSLWRGASNRAAGKSFTVSADTPVLVYRPHRRTQRK